MAVEIDLMVAGYSADGPSALWISDYQKESAYSWSSRCSPYRTSGEKLRWLSAAAAAMRFVPKSESWGISNDIVVRIDGLALVDNRAQSVAEKRLLAEIRAENDQWAVVAAGMNVS